MMKIGKELLKVISKKYAPLSVIDIAFGRYDLTLKTNSEGDPILLFAGKRDDKGLIKGDRFSRTIKYDSTGKVIKDHWERKGKASSLMRIFILCTLITIISCSNNKQAGKTDYDTTQLIRESADSIPDFAIQTGKGYLSIRDWTDKNDPENLLGPPLSSNKRILGEGADTFMGSTIKTLKYDGLEITLFSPIQNGKTFWVKDIRLSNNRYKTSKGLVIGDPIQKLDSIYPGLDFNHDSSAKIYTGTDDNYIYFGIADSLIKEIHIYKELP